jgi:serine/threonine protein kinase
MAEYELTPGQMVGEYRVERKIGEGGFGKVYAAVHPVIGKAAAVKILNPQLARSPEIVSRFADEARAVNQIRHRNIIDIFAFGTLPGGLHYFVMEMLEGTPLDDYLKKNAPLEPGHALSLLWPVGRALVAAHKAGIAHRDLKPENVFLTVDADGVIFPKLLDFGIAKLLHEGEMANRTRTGAMMGTPYYMSPEQCRGVGVDHRSDIYSFAIMIHEVLTGKKPFDAENVMDLLMKQISATPPAMSQVRPDLPRALDAPVLRMLDKSAERRPQTMSAALDELAAAARTIGIDLAASVPSSLLAQGARASGSPPVAGQGPSGQGPSPATGAGHLDTGAWLHQSGGAGAPAGMSGQTPAPARTGPSGHTPAQPAGAWGPAATELGPPPVGPYGTPAPTQAVSSYGTAPPHGPTLQSPGAPPYAPAAAPARARSSSTWIIVLVAVLGGVFLLFMGGLVIGLAALGGADTVELRAEAPPVGATFDRDVSTTASIRFSAPGEPQPRFTSESRANRRYRLTVQSVSGSQVSGAEVQYGDNSRTTTFSGAAPTSDATAVANRTYRLSGQESALAVSSADGHDLSDLERAELLADVGHLFAPRPAVLAGPLDLGDAVSLTSEEALSILAAGAVSAGTTLRVEGATLTLVSVEGDRAKFEIAFTSVQDGFSPKVHIESRLTGTVTLDTRSGVPLAVSVTGPLDGTLATDNGTLTISGTMKIEGR